MIYIFVKDIYWIQKAPLHSALFYKWIHTKKFQKCVKINSLMAEHFQNLDHLWTLISQLYNNKIQKNTLCFSSNTSQRDSVLMALMAAHTLATICFMVLHVGLLVLATRCMENRNLNNKKLCKEHTWIQKAMGQSSRLQA